MSLGVYLLNYLGTTELRKYVQHCFLRMRLRKKSSVVHYSTQETIKLFFDDILISKNIQGFFTNASIFFYSNTILTETKVYNILASMLNTTPLYIYTNFKKYIDKILSKLILCKNYNQKYVSEESYSDFSFRMMRDDSYCWDNELSTSSIQLSIIDSEVKGNDKVSSIDELVEDPLTTQLKRIIRSDTERMIPKAGNIPLNIMYRPIIISSTLSILRKIGLFKLKKLGFKKVKNLSGINFWIYIPSTSHKFSKTPFLFLHGFGIGISPYSTFLQHIMENRMIVCPELKCIANPALKVRNPPSIHSICQTIKYFMDEVLDPNNNTYDIGGHSFGSSLVPTMTRIDERIRKKVLIDPICFVDNWWHIGCFTTPNYHVIKQNKKSKFKFWYTFGHYTFGSFMYNQEIISRYFNVSDIILSKEELDDSFLVILSLEDFLIPTVDIAESLKSIKKCNYYIIKERYHGDIIYKDEMTESAYEFMGAFLDSQPEIFILN